jgi:hypothetical protein
MIGVGAYACVHNKKVVLKQILTLWNKNCLFGADNLLTEHGNGSAKNK